jgi:hypothetical protein
VGVSLPVDETVFFEHSQLLDQNFLRHADDLIFKFASSPWPVGQDVDDERLPAARNNAYLTSMVGPKVLSSGVSS